MGLERSAVEGCCGTPSMLMNRRSKELALNMAEVPYCGVSLALKFIYLIM